MRGRRSAAVLGVLVMVLGATDAAARDGAELLGADGSILVREPQVRPDVLGADPIEELRYGDPSEGLDLVEAPDADSSGDALLDLPLSIPAGRGGVQPDLTLSYDSGAAGSWLGTGWDLDLGSIEVDTTFGVPRYLNDKESETYVLDGDQLSPTAVRTDFADRVGPRAEFTRRVETEHELVIRHGTNPSNYWWEVRDKLGAVRWYGGTPDLGGAAGNRPPGGGLDESAVLRGPGGAIYRWALSAKRDVGVNMMRLKYEKKLHEPVGGDVEGRQLYLSEVTYTHTSGPEETEDPAYQVRFLRDGDMDEPPARRKDVIVDGTGGFLEVTRDLLRRIEIWTGDPFPSARRRDFNKRSKAFRFHYREGAFGKTLLTRVDQVGSDNQVFAHNDLDYYDDVRDEDGDYNGFAGATDWDTHDDSLFQNIVQPFGTSALGSSESNAGDVHAFLGFSPSGPTKTTAIGGGLSVNGGATQATVEFFDINGDGLPDKVFREKPGEVRYRLNRSGATGNTTFSDDDPVIEDLDNLSTDFGIGVGGSVEAYLGGTVQFNVGTEVSVGEEYFEDVNNDGLPDFVSAGTVYFNRLDDDGVPRFDRSSAGTRAPIGVRDLDFPNVDALDKLEADQRASSPTADTVRRWVAPYAGTVDVAGAVTFDPQPDTRVPRPESYDGDGVRVAIQFANNELWAARLENPGDEATPTGVDDIHVEKGQAIYFRIQPVDEGVLDQVRWDPRISYDDFDSPLVGPDTDVNGRSQRVFRASEDFTIAGRPAQEVPAPFTGTVRFEATLTKLRPVTDDVTVVVEKNGVDVVRHRIPAQELHPTGLDFGVDISTVEPDVDEQGYGTRADMLSVRLEVDSDIDVTGIDWRPRLYYTSATKDGQPVTVVDSTGKHLIDLPVLPYIDLYPTSSDEAPPLPAGPHVAGYAKTTIRTTGALPGTEAILTVKTSEGPVAKQKLTITSADAGHITQETLVFDPPADGELWYELAFRSDIPGAVLDDVTVVDNLDRTIRFSLKRQGPQGYFPLPYRGWGYAGYSGQGADPTAPMDEASFTFRREQFSEEPPTTWDEDGSTNPVNAKAYPFLPHRLELKAQDGTVTGVADVWRGAKDTIVGGAGFARASRRGVDKVDVAQQPAGASVGGSVRAPRRVGITGPTFAFTAGIGPLGASVGGAPSFGLVDYVDMNGDGFPDVISPNTIKFTGPRGAYRETGSGPAVVNMDTTFAAGGGFGGSAVGPKADSRGEANTPQGASSSSNRKRRIGTGRTYSPDGSTGSSGSIYGFNLGGSLGIEAELTNPAVPPSWATGIDGATFEEDFADINGDGLPDRIRADVDSVRVALNLGYDFSDEIEWTDGGFESGESYSGNIGGTLGFQYNFKEFAGGVSYNEGIGVAAFTWVDLNADGILDRLRKHGTEVSVAFGTGTGLMEETDYGSWHDGFIDLIGEKIPLGEQIAQDRSRGIGGGFDFTFGIGPLCLPSVNCYIIVNPGVHLDHTVNNTAVALVDIDGDGAPEPVRSNDDDEIEVRRNRLGRTNLLRSVDNPLGGEIRLGYKRAGNTTKQPSAQWVLASVESDDGHRGDGEDVQLRTFEYEDGVYDPLERTFLGYGTVTEKQRRFADDGDVHDDTVLRVIERTYENATVFDSGLETSETIKTPGDVRLRSTHSTWETADLETGDAVDATAREPGERLALALSPRRTKLEQRWYDGDGNQTQETWHDFRHDELGNIVWQHDEGEPEDDGDDLFAEMTPSNCHISLGEELAAELQERDGYTCGGASPADRTSPLWDPDRCPTWTSIPAKYEVRDAEGKLLRSRNGSPKLCDNSSVTRLEERTGNGDELAVTRLDYDDFGSYNHISYPGETEDDRLTVDYVYDDHNHKAVARTEDSHGVVAEAGYDGRTGRISWRKDANGQITRYHYDAAHRLDSIDGPYDSGHNRKTIEFEYDIDAPTPYVFARHYDAANPDDRIETITFADGLGRVVQTKRDATVHRGADEEPDDVMVVEDNVAFDAFGQPVREWYPTTEELGTAHVLNPDRSMPSTRTTYNTAGRVTDVEHPNGTHTRTAYGFGGSDVVGATVFTTTVTDPEGKAQRLYADVRNNVLASEERPDGAAVRRTRYSYDALGRLTRVVEPGGGTTTHTYDLLGRRTATDGPDAGRIERRFDKASNLVAEITPRLRAVGARIDYEYDRERLTRITYPDLDAPSVTPDVEYEWGGLDAPEHAVGRVVRMRDGARDQTFGYDRLGRVAREQTLMLVPGYDATAETRARNTYTTSFTYDTFGRPQTMRYPDGEVLSHEYDSGGLLRRVEGEKAGRTYRYVDRLEYDEFDAERLRTMLNGTRTSFAYDPLTRNLSRQVTDAPQREIQDLNYAYDLVGNVTRLDNRLPDPETNLKGGPGWQTYEYDPYHRLRAGQGTYLMAGKRRDHTFTTGYDVAGNVASKQQTDVISGAGKRTTVDPTTYATAFTYDATRVHQMTKAGVRAPRYDANGNLTGWPAAKNTKARTHGWDSADNMTSVTDGSTTAYQYGAEGDLGIERAGTNVRAIVNDWYVVFNGTKAYKYVWAGQTRVAAKRVGSPDNPEDDQRFLHDDLQGSVNIVTDAEGLVREHSEYFPTGEIWVREDTTNGTPGEQVGGEPEAYQYAGGFLSGPGAMSHFGERWYSPRDEAFTAPDALLEEEPDRVVEDPALLPGYTYAESNAVRLVDEDGRDPDSAQNVWRYAMGVKRPAAPAPRRSGGGAAPARAAVVRRPAGPSGPLPGAAKTRVERLNSRLGAIAERLDAYPLVDFTLLRTDDGWKLQNLGFAPLGFYQYSPVDRDLSRRKLATKKRKPKNRR